LVFKFFIQMKDFSNSSYCVTPGQLA